MKFLRDVQETNTKNLDTHNFDNWSKKKFINVFVKKFEKSKIFEKKKIQKFFFQKVRGNSKKCVSELLEIS